LLVACPALRLVVTFSVGVDHVDSAALRRRSIPLVHTPDVLTDATADLAMALILACARRLRPGVRFVEEGHFEGFDPGLFLGLALANARLGIVGLGKIGTAVARRALGFGMTVTYVSPQEKRPAFPAVRVSLEQCLREADIVTLHAPLVAEARGLIGRRELAAMKPRGVLVNTARGPLVDEQALLAHLRTHPEFYAGLDVYEHEPRVDPALAALPNAICLPHLGSATEAARLGMARICTAAAIQFSRGEKPEPIYVGG